MDSQLDYHAARALLEWQIELGVTESIAETPINRFEVPETLAKPERAPAPVAAHKGAASPELVDADNTARQLAADAPDLVALKAAVAGFEHCELKRGARSLVFGDGNPTARVMVIGDAPDRHEDIEGRPFAGPAGLMLDKMFAAIDMERHVPDVEKSIYVTTVLPWRTPQDREPGVHELEMMLPFVHRHVELVAPDILVLMGNVSCQALTGQKGVARLRGRWTSAMDRPALAMFHPAHLLRNPSAKRDAWNDLLMLQARLQQVDA
jgi:uracil-DNA glycosylase family 4